MDETIIDLQTRLAFQEDAIDQLHLALARQQQEIDGLRRLVEQLRLRVSEFTPALVGNAHDEPPPPHY